MDFVGMTMTQKILAAHAGLEKVEAGQLIEAELDLVLGNDITSPVAIHEMEKMKAEGVFHKDKIALVMDHFIPNKDIKSAENCKCVREFAARHEITNYFDVGEMGIEHALLPESGLTVAGDAIIGADSHTCTYGALGAFSTGVGSTDMAAAMVTGKAWFKVPSAIRINLIGKPSKWVSGKDVILHLIGKIGVDGALYKSLEFTGEGVKNLSMDDRFTIANMAIEAGAKNGIFPVDEKTEEYMKEHSKRPYKRYEPDEDAVYDEEYTIDLSKLRPTVAFPHLPSNTKTIDEIQDDVFENIIENEIQQDVFQNINPDAFYWNDDIYEEIEQRALRETFEKLMGELSEREQEVLKARYGFEDGVEKTLEEVGQTFGVTRERIRQIESKALRKLSHPTRIRKLKDFL